MEDVFSPCPAELEAKSHPLTYTKARMHKHKSSGPRTMATKKRTNVITATEAKEVKLTLGCKCLGASLIVSPARKLVSPGCSEVKSYKAFAT